MQLSIELSSVFVVSGGAKGITAQCVIKLAENYPCKWILLGRSEFCEHEPTWAQGCVEESKLKKRILENLLQQGKKPTPAEVQKIYKKIASGRKIKKTLQAIRQLGREVDYLSVDITDADALEQKLADAVKRMGAITGIIHGAGNLADKLIENKTQQDFETVVTTKVKGLENLLRCVPLRQLQYLMLFSSVAGFYGNAGQTDYALANEILNKSAHLVKLNHPQCRVIAINWGPWESGMVNPALKKAFADRNIAIISVESGTQMLAQEIAQLNSQSSPQVIIGSPLPLPTCKVDSQLRTHRIRRQLTVEANPFLGDHVIGGYPVLPFTCALSWMSTLPEQLYPGYRTFICEEVRVLKGIIFDENLAREYVLDLTETSKTKDKIVLEAKISSENQAGKVRYNYNGKIELLREFPPAPIYESLDLVPNNTSLNTEQNFYQQGDLSLFHGSAFRGVEQVINANQNKITVKCFVPSITPRQQGQFPLINNNPYTTDVQTHAVWLWLKHYYQSGCLPAKIRRFEQFAPTPFDRSFYTSVEIKSKTDTSLIINVITHDDRGQIYSRISEAQATIFPLPFPVSNKVA